MKKRFFFLTMACFIMIGCSSTINQSDYNAIVTERDSLKEKNQELERIRLEQTKQIIDLEKKQLDSDTALIEVESWADVCFGEGIATCLENDMHLSVHVNSSYSESADSIKPIWKECLTAISLLPQLNIHYSSIEIIYFGSEDHPIIMFDMLMGANGYELNGIMVDAQKTSDYIPSLSNIN